MSECVDVLGLPVFVLYVEEYQVPCLQRGDAVVQEKRDIHTLSCAQLQILTDVSNICKKLESNLCSLHPSPCTPHPRCPLLGPGKFFCQKSIRCFKVSPKLCKESDKVSLGRVTIVQYFMTDVSYCLMPTFIKIHGIYLYCLLNITET